MAPKKRKKRGTASGEGDESKGKCPLMTEEVEEARKKGGEQGEEPLRMS